MAETRKTVVKFRTRAEFDDSYLPDLPHGGVFVPTDEDYKLGDSVLVYLCFPEVPQGVPLRGTVIWRRAPTKWRSALKPGIGIRFDEAELERRDFLLSFVRGKIDPRRGRHRRVPADFRVDFSLEETWNTGRALNISREGIFILTEEYVKKDSSLQMKLFLKNAAQPDLYFGKVRWHCPRKPEIGLGVEFRFRSPIHRRKIHRYVVEREEILMAQVPQLARSQRATKF